MLEYDVISKGKYKYSQPDGFVIVESYILIKENEKKYLLLKFGNKRDEQVKDLNFVVTQFNSDGEKISAREINLKDVNGSASSSFVVNDKIELYDDCSDFKVNVISANYDNYLYKQRSDEVSTDFVSESERDDVNISLIRNRMGGKDSVVKELKAKVPVFICVLAILTALCILAVSIIQINTFKLTQDTFLKSGIEYSFADENKSDDCDIYVTGYNGKVSSVVIPEKIQNHTVTKILSGAFKSDKYIKNLKINGNVIIEDNAFNSCDNLASVIFNNVNFIGNNAFEGCKSLTSVTAHNLEEIGEHAFYGCSSLTTVDISNDTKTLSIGVDAFANCRKLNNVAIDQTVKYPDDVSLFSESVAITQLSLKNYPENNNEAYPLSRLFGYYNTLRSTSLSLNSLTIENMTAIPNDFCNGVNLNSVTIKNITDNSLSDRAFYNCTNLETVNLPGTVEYVGESALYGTKISSFDGSALVSIGANAFENCTRLKDVAIKNNKKLNTIGAGAFEGCSSLASIDIPENITVINEQTFASCSSLTSINLPENLQIIGICAFKNCTKLAEISLPQSLNELGDNAFYGCSALTEFTIPDSVEFIGNGIFAECTKLEAIEVPFLGKTIDVSQNASLAYLFGATGLINDGSYYVVSNLKKVTVTSATNIASHAFDGCSNIEVVVLPNAKQIGEYAFNECSALNDIEFSDLLESIQSYAFAYCSSIVNFEITANVTNIGSGIFYNCNSLANLTLSYIPNGKLTDMFSMNGEGGLPVTLKQVTINGDNDLPDNAFANCNYIEDITLSGNVENIGNNAFEDCGSLRNITLPSSVTTIGSYAFSSCNSLTSITIPSKVTAISPYTFKNCINLKTISMHNDLEAIGEYAFYGCYALKEIVIPDNVSSMACGIFYNCTNLAKITLPFLGTTKDDTQNGYLAYMFGANDKTGGWNITSNLKKVTVTTATSIENYAFSNCSNIETIEIPSAKSIGSYSFQNCTSLKSFELPDNLTTIKDHAFYCCSSLTDIKIADNVTSIGIGIFAGCSSLKSLTLSNITSGKLSYLFCWNSNSDYFAIPSSLKKVTITEETVVADSAFYSCNNIETVALPDETTSIGSYAFYGCSSLKDFTIPTSVKTIGSYAFSGCTSMYQITLPASLTSIGSNAFNSCFRLYIIYNNSNINVSAGMLNSSYEAYGNTAIGVYDESDKPVIVYDGNYQFLLADDAWYMIDYPTDTSLILPASFNYNDQVITQYALPDNLFRGASEITDIAIPAVITYLGGYCFYQCESLQNLTINNDSTFDSIDMWTFDNCGSLKSFNVPSAVEEICSYAFYNCNNLRSITLPKSLKSIDNTAFYSCSRLYEITNYSTLNIVCGDNSYGNVASYALAVYKSDDDKKADFFTYANADMAYYNGTITLIGVADDVISISLPTITYSENYTTCNIATEAFKNSNLQQVLIGVNINTVGDWAFGYNYNLSEVKFTGTVKSFGSYAFYNCGSLKTVTLPEGLTKIGDSAFYYCSNLAKVTLPKSLTDLGENAFSNCSGITSIEIPDGVKTINSGTFRYCTRLLSVLIPSSVTSIANGAFDGCNHLIVVYNLSSLNIVAGSNSNGNVAYYAIKVLNDTSYKIDYCDDGNYYFCKIDDEWYLYSYSTNLSTPYKLPESFVYDNKKITSYTIKNGTFNYYVNSIVIPTSVNAIQDGAFSGLNNIFFKGTAEEWDKLGANVRYNNVYYYSECVHEYGYWTYYNDGIVSAPSFSQIEERTATCTQEGLVKTVCNYCNKTISEDKIAMIDHEPDDKGICKMCGKDLNAKEPTEDLSCDN